MNVSEALKAAGYEPEKSTVGDKFIYNGVYKCTVYDIVKMEDKGYGESIYAQFKVQEVMSGDTSYSKYPEFKGYFNMAPDKIANKRNGLAKLLNGLFSAGIEVNTATDDIVAELQKYKGSEVYINAYRQEPRKLNEATKQWEEDPDGEAKQAFAFMTKSNAEKRAKKLDDKKPF